MKSIAIKTILLTIFVLILTMPFDGGRAQTKPAEVIAAKPIEIPFSPSDAIEIAKLRRQIDEANAQLMSIIKTYNIGENGEFIMDGKGNWIGVRRIDSKVDPKIDPKKP